MLARKYFPLIELIHSLRHALPCISGNTWCLIRLHVLSFETKATLMHRLSCWLTSFNRQSKPRCYPVCSHCYSMTSLQHTSQLSRRFIFAQLYLWWSKMSQGSHVRVCTKPFGNHACDLLYHLLQFLSRWYALLHVLPGGKICCNRTS